MTRGIRLISVMLMTLVPHVKVLFDYFLLFRRFANLSHAYYLLPSQTIRFTCGYFRYQFLLQTAIYNLNRANSHPICELWIWCLLGCGLN